MNKTILITTRDYYSLNSEIVSPVEVSLESFSKFLIAITEKGSASGNNERSMACIMGGKKKKTNQDDNNPLDAIKKMFIKGGSSEDKKKYKGFWDDWDYKFYLKHLLIPNPKQMQEKQETIKQTGIDAGVNECNDKEDDNNIPDYFDIYVAPCFPTKFKDTNLEIRHQYIQVIFGKLLNEDSILLAHDLDLFLNNDERFLTKEDCQAANNVFTENTINFSNIFGFQHVDDPHTIYSDFIKKIGTDNLTPKLCNDIIEKLIDKENNLKYYKQVDEYPFQSGQKSKEGLETLIQKIVIA